MYYWSWLQLACAQFICSEFYDREDSKYEPLKLFLDIFDYCSLYCFVLEIILKWMDHFTNFWKNNWNIFDFIVTFIVSIRVLSIFQWIDV